MVDAALHQHQLLTIAGEENHCWEIDRRKLSWIYHRVARDTRHLSRPSKF